MKINVTEPGVGFDLSYELPGGLVVPALHPRYVGVAPEEIPGADQVEVIRSQVAETVDARFRSLLDGLSTLELMTMHAAYQGAVAAYMVAVSGLAAGAVRDAQCAVRSPPSPAAAQAPMPQRTAHSASRTAPQSVRLHPDEPLPGMFGGERWGRGRDPSAPPVIFNAARGLVTDTTSNGVKG